MYLMYSDMHPFIRMYANVFRHMPTHIAAEAIIAHLVIPSYTARLYGITVKISLKVRLFLEQFD